jgi:hypothetical protein
MGSWLDDCLTTHELCISDEVNISTAPTRLLSVANGKLSLVHVSKLPTVPPYFTLSHCWGSIDIFKLTRNNIQEFEAGISEEALCRTFREAVELTRALEFQYIWIDSLCIIQDDLGDWREEASKMSGVYGGSFLNLAASAAKDGSVGLSHQRSDNTLRRIQRYRIEASCGSRSRWFDCVDSSIYYGSMTKCPLATRGWAFQERFLAPRTVHFTKTQLYWECRDKMACETYPDKLPQTLMHTVVERDQISQIWSSAVSHYSRCELTFSRDRLVAISGVAKWLHYHTGDEYVAGLWRRNLESQLLWEIVDTGTARQRLEEFPSWSWAAWEGEIMMGPGCEPSPKFVVISHVVDTDLIFAGSNIYGEVLSGKLKLRTTPLIGCKIRNKVGSKESRATFLNGRAATCGIYNDMRGHQTLEDFEDLLYFLPIMAQRRYSDRSTGPDKLASGWKRVIAPIIQGLMLQSLDGSPRGCFRRVGCFWDWREDHLVSAMDDPKCWADESVYEGMAGSDEEGRPQYHISII